MTDSLIYVNETPWGKLGTTIDHTPKDSEDIIKSCGLDWTTETAEMKTDLHGVIPKYHAVYVPEKNNQVLGVVSNAANPRVIQNEEMFASLEYLIGNELEFDCAGVYKNGQKVFGVFKFQNEEKVLDDPVGNYIICMNDHLKVDGKVSIIHSPIRIACTNMLNYAVANSRATFRIPVTTDVGINRDVAQSVFNSCQENISYTNKKANEMLSINISRENIEEILDNLFPYQLTNTGDMIQSKANEKVSIIRDTFVNNCLAADNLANYRGTAYQVYNALLDYSQHYFTKADHAYDLGKRMSRIPNFGDPYEGDKTRQFMKMYKKYAVG